MNSISKSVCKSCGRAFYPFHARCPSCGGSGFDSRAIEGTAVLVTFTRVHMLSLAYTDRFITLGIAEFADGTRALGRLDVDEPEIGMKLGVTIGPVREEGYAVIEGLIFTRA